MRMIRVAPLPVADWELGLLEQALVVTNGGLRVGANIYGTLANYPKLFIAWLHLGAQVLRGSELTPRHRELAILRITALTGGQYPFTQHVRIGAEAGLDERAVEAVCNGPTDALWRASDQVLLSAVDELSAGGAISNGTWACLTVEFSNQQILDIIATAAFYRMAAWMLNSCGTPMDIGQAPKLGSVEPAIVPGRSAYVGSPRIEPLPVAQWANGLLQATSAWPRFKANPEVRNARVYGTLANHPALFAAIGPIMAHILVDISLSESQREIVIVRACFRDHGAYPFRQHVRIGRAAGLPDAEIAALGEETPKMCNQRDQLLVDWVDELHDTGTICSATWQRGNDHFETCQLLDLTLAAGFYGLISFVLSAARTKLEDGEATLPPNLLWSQ